MPREQPWTKRPPPEPFDVGRFLRAAGVRSYPYEQDHQTPEITGLWWDDEQEFFGRGGDELTYTICGHWGTLARVMPTWPFR